VKAHTLRRFEGMQSQYISVFISAFKEMELNLVVQGSAAGTKDGGPASLCCRFIVWRGCASQAGVCALGKGGIHEIAEVAYPRNSSSSVGDA
jgi:hypothetical protein